MKIKLLDDVLEQDNLDNLEIHKEYEVIRTEFIRDDLYYLVKNELNKVVFVHEILVEEVI